MKFLYVFVFLVLVVSSVLGFSAVCPAIYSPVCGTDGKTYSNKCMLEGAGATFSHDGQCN